MKRTRSTPHDGGQRNHGWQADFPRSMLRDDVSDEGADRELAVYDCISDDSCPKE